MYHYQRALGKNEVLVCLIDKREIYPELSKEILLASKQYGFTYCNSYDEFEKISEINFLLKHVIIFDGLDKPELITLEYEKILSNFTSATLAISYSSKETFNAASQVIEDLKKCYEKLNYLRPTEYGIKFIPTLEKLIDNSICDSVRIKYQAKCHSNNINDILTEDIKEYFQDASNLIHRHNLFHRSSTDGFISLRYPQGGFFITATKTNKVKFDFNRISYVHSYNKDSNILTYSGTYLPSSDSVEASIIYAELPDVNAILHTHASQQFTRNPSFFDKIAVPPMRYGESKLGDSLVRYFKSRNTCDIAIMEDHGELFLSKEPLPKYCIQEIKKTIENNLF